MIALRAALWSSGRSHGLDLWGDMRGDLWGQGSPTRTRRHAAKHRSRRTPEFGLHAESGDATGRSASQAPIGLALSVQHGKWLHAPRWPFAEQLPDSRTRNRLGEVAAATRPTREIAARFGATGYVVDTVPLALFAASAMIEAGAFRESISALVAAGGDTDTIASIAGQVAGAHVGLKALPLDLLPSLHDTTLVEGIAAVFATRLEAR